MSAQAHVVSQMGDRLQAEVERQLIADLKHYYPDLPSDDVAVDWSGSCQEGHVTRVLDGVLEEMSDVVARDGTGNVVASGWLDFVHGAEDLPLHVFWLFLDLHDGETIRRVKDDAAIPDHVWLRLSVESRNACLGEARYDSRWFEDPKVLQWKRDRKLSNV